MASTKQGAVCAAIAIMFASVTAWAQSAPAANGNGASNDQDHGLREIVVTAQRRQQGVLSVPLSVTALDGDRLNRMGVQDLTQLQYTTPGFVPSEKAGTTLLYVRGVGNGVLAGADASVATYVDDVPRIYQTLVTSLVDVERIEVLKGAQGGLYGRNATGGVLNIITRQPSLTESYGGALLSYGEHRNFRASAYGSIPLSSWAALSLSVQRDSRGPDVRNVSRTPPYTAANFPTGSYLGTPQETADFFNSKAQPLKGYGDEDLWSAYAKLLLKPANNLRITLAGDFSHRRDTDGTQSLQTEPAYALDRLRTLFATFGINAALPDGFFVLPAKKFEISAGFTPSTLLRDYGGSATTVLNLGSLDLTSITAYRQQDSTYYSDLGFSRAPLVTSISPKDQHYFYQELRAASTGNGPFHFLGGATYLRNHVGMVSTTGILPPLFDTAPTTISVNIRNWSVYAQGKYDITSALSLTVSGRYLHETNSTAFTTPVVSAGRLVAHKFLPSATLSYALPQGGTAYARYAKGFKAGGINPVVAPVFFEGSKGGSFLPESVDTYEVGYRASLFKRTVQFTSALFYNDYSNLQTSASAQPQYTQIIYALVNAGTARTYGAEASILWRASRTLTLGANGGYLNAKYKTFAIASDPVLQPFDHSGQRMVNAPTFQFSTNADLDQPITGTLKLTGNVTAAYTTKIVYAYSGAVGLLPDGIQPAYWQVNTRAGIATLDYKYRLSVFANNLFNKEYFTYIVSAAGLGNGAQLGRPRVIGVELSTKF